jgi:ESX secretion system protein EccD
VAVTAPVGVGLARVTVTAPKRRIDVALPEDMPVAALLPNLIRHSGEGTADAGEQHGGWVLRRAMGTALELTRSLAAQGVRDGEILHLVPRRQEWPELEYDDVVEAIAGGARRYGRSWGNVATRRCGLAVASAVFLLGLADLTLATRPWAIAGAVALLVAVVAVTTGAVLSRALSDSIAGAVVAGCGLPYGFLGGFLIAGPDVGLTRFGAPEVLLGSVVLLVFGVIGYFAVAAMSRLFTAAMTLGLLGGIGGLLGLTSLSAAAATAIVMTIGIGLMPGYPLLAIRLGKLPVPQLPNRPEEMLADTPVPPRSEVYSAVMRSDELLTGLLLGIAAISVAGSVILAISQQTSSVTLIMVAACALLLRARLFPTPRQRIPMIAAGGAGLGVLMVAFALEAASNATLYLLLLITAVVGAFVLISGLLFSRRPPSPYLGRTADILDVLAIIGLVPVTCIIAGLYGYVQGVFAGII